MKVKLTTRPKKELYFKFRDISERMKRFLDIVQVYTDSDEAVLFDDVLEYVSVTENVLRKYSKHLNPPVRMSIAEDKAKQKWVVFDTIKEVNE